jgi:L-ribulose-5-phosphate 3-epimerase
MDDRLISRRRLLELAAVAATAPRVMAGAMDTPGPDKPKRLRKAVLANMLPKDMADADRFRLVRECGFDGIEVPPMADLKAAAAQARLAKEEGLAIHSVLYGSWPPLTQQDAAPAAKAVEDMENAIRCAHEMGADTVLLVPTRVTEDFSYREAYVRSQEVVRRLIPCAEQARVYVGIENVWNKFLLSPIEFARYIDELDSPWVRAYFDVGNVIIHGYAQDWIRTLGKRIVKLHLKDFNRQGYRWTNLLDGDVNWPQVRKAMDETGFEGWMTAELEGGDRAYLTDVAKRIDRIVAMT